MEVGEGQGLVIKMAQKNKETQTVKIVAGGGMAPNWFNAAAYTATGGPFTGHPLAAGPPAMQHHPISCQFYMDREEQLYRRACQMKGIRVERLNEIREEEDDSVGSEEEPSKVIYRYTLDEMKSYNPYRFINF
ncbi:uncharacterized protein Dana_GF11482 [Drosophila ananassae]|uniref:Uncharacterized protein n=1 Tax=Drosophila ananassae TaxID=7217 RepID=B3MCR2_DROAN|nr:uncharacterized protein LOC6494346 [Drosophila ananassae]EDV37314.1 uncharacterized protein Dana_GF11482 [Drosophila ananassae]